MMFSTIQALAAPFFLLSHLIQASPVPIVTRDTDEAYVLADCVNNVTKAGYALVLYYSDFSIVSDYPVPDLIGSISLRSTVVWEGKTWTVATPFKFSATIPTNASSAVYDTYVGPASTSTYAGPSQALKWNGELMWSPITNVNCFADYIIVDLYED